MLDKKLKFDKYSKIVFIIAFLLMLVIPLVTTNLKENEIAEFENRFLAPQAKIYNDNGSINKEFLSDFELWINDNIGGRYQMIGQNARMQYYLFNVLENNSNIYLGPDEELNYITPEIIVDYQHKNLYPDSYLTEFADSMKKIDDYAASKGAELFYYQCWDKQTIYPEYFPKSIFQYGDISKTDTIVSTLEEQTDINVISPKKELIEAKDKYATYSVWGDPTHWSPRGAYIGYLKLMENLNANLIADYKILSEDDYNIQKTDLGRYYIGGIHKPDLIEPFEIKKAEAVLTNEKLTLYSEDERHAFYTNDCVENDTRVLILGDSYFADFLCDDFAESFHEVIIIWGDYLYDVQSVIDEYNPDIVIIEAAERVDRTVQIIRGAGNINQ